MKKKKNWWIVLMAFTAIVMTAGLTACGNDDDETGKNEEQEDSDSYASMIIGKWYTEEEYEKGDKLGYQFFSNGTGKGYEYNETTGSLGDSWNIEWYIRGDKLSITELIEGEYDMDTYNIVSITANHVLIREKDADGEDCYTKFSRVTKFPWE